MDSHTGDMAAGSAVNAYHSNDKEASPVLNAQDAVVPNYGEKVQDSNERVTFLGLTGVKLNLLIAICAGVGFVLFGYDQ
ncbi:hypothetical protein MOBT1_001486, partial [Malassezia obtusa]